MEDGAILSKCQDIDLPAGPLFTIPAKLPMSSFITTDIDSLMALVSVDSITAYIQRAYKNFCVNGFTNVKADGKLATIYAGGRFEQD